MSRYLIAFVAVGEFFARVSRYSLGVIEYSARKARLKLRMLPKPEAYAISEKVISPRFICFAA